MDIVNLEITTKIGCSNMCVYCPQELLIREYKKRSNQTHMSLDTFKRCIGKVDKDVRIGFTGMCEPFLNDRCVDMIEIAAKTHRPYVSTTLVGLKLKDIKRLEKIDFVYFAVHLPGKSGENIPVTRKYKKLLVKIIKSKIPNKGYHYHGELNTALNFVEGRKIVAHSRAGNMEHLISTSLKGPVGCKRNFAHSVLLPNGDIVLCCMDYGLKHILGNLLTQSINEIYSGKEFARVVEATKKDTGSICHKCYACGYQKNNMLKLHIGCRNEIKEGYDNIDLYYGPIKMDMFDLKYPDNSVDEILSHHTLEHAGHGIYGDRGVPQALKEWLRILKPGGSVEIVIPDTEKCIKGWLKSTKLNDYSNMQLWGQQTNDGDYHRVGFKKTTIGKYFINAGFVNIKVRSYKGRRTPSIIIIANKKR